MKSKTEKSSENPGELVRTRLGQRTEWEERGTTLAKDSQLRGLLYTLPGESGQEAPAARNRPPQE